MRTDAGKAYFSAFRTLKEKDYPATLGFLKSAEIQFADDLDFRILKETTRLLLAVKNEISGLKNNLK